MAKECSDTCDDYYLGLDYVDIHSSRTATMVTVLCGGQVHMSIERFLALAPVKAAEKIRGLLAAIREEEKS